MSRRGRGRAIGRACRKPRSTAPGHDTRIRNLSSVAWQVSCSCGWVRDCRWALTARDASAGHLLDVAR